MCPIEVTMQIPEPVQFRLGVPKITPQIISKPKVSTADAALVTVRDIAFLFVG